MNAALDPSRLYTVLIKTGLQTKDPVLYQLLYNLIGNLVNQKAQLAGIASNTTNQTVENISNIIQILGGGDGDGGDGSIGPPGQQGIQGVAGSTGPAGVPFPPIIIDAYEGDSFVPGPQGNVGSQGLTGPSGEVGVTIILDAFEGDSFVPGPQGNTGATGSTGAAGVAGPAGTSFILREEEINEQLIVIPQTLASIPSSSVLTYRSNAQAIPVTTETAITFDAVLFDSNVFWAVGNPTRLTVPAGLGGKYIVVGQVKWNLTGTGPFYLRIYKNGATLVAENTVSIVELTSAIQIVAEVELIPTDYIELKIYQNSSGGTENTTGGSAQTYLAMTLAAGVIAGGTGGGGAGVGFLTLSSPAAPPANPVNISTLGTLDWYALTSSFAPIQLQNGTIGFPHRKKYGIYFLDGFFIFGPTGTPTVQTGAGMITTVSTTASDDMSGFALAAFATGQFVQSSTAGYTGYGVGFQVVAGITQRTLKFVIRSFSAVITVAAHLSDGSAVDVSNATMDSGAAAALEKEFTIVFSSAINGQVLTVTALVTTNRGSTPHVGLIYVYLN